MFKYIYGISIPVLVLLVFCTIIPFARLNSYIKKAHYHFLLNKCFALASFYSIIYITVISRTVNVFDVELRPFYTFVMAQSQVEYYRTFFMNGLLFVPLGLSLPYVLSAKPRKWPVFVTVGFAAILSAGIEFCQYYYHLGRCETDDVIANTLGAAIGTLSYLLYIRILKNREESLMNSKISDTQILLLRMCAKALFGREFVMPKDYDAQKLVNVAKVQTVLPLVYSFIKDNVSNDCSKLYSNFIAKNIRVIYGHSQVHQALSEANIPYVILKGVASAAYYPEATLRTMGDVDVLVSPDDIEKANEVLKSIGFITTDDIYGDDMHIGYKRNDGVSCELHRRIGWIPQNDLSVVYHKYLDDILTSSIEYKTSNGSCIIPDGFHHGLVLLLHTATHLTHEGVGIRHLCDWAVFVNSFSNEDFINTFENPLKEMGLWRFAQLLTLCCIKYLGCDDKAWAGTADDNLIEEIITDILNGGNFGHNDAERYKQIKYLNDRKEGIAGKKSPILQALSSINAKTKNDFAFVNKAMVLLPLGWTLTIVKYLYMVLVGKRSLDNVSTISGAQKRKNIYDEFKLYKNDQE